MDIEKRKQDAEDALAEYGKLLFQRDNSMNRSISKQELMDEYISAQLSEYVRLDKIYQCALAEQRIEELLDI